MVGSFQKVLDVMKRSLAAPE